MFEGFKGNIWKMYLFSFFTNLTFIGAILVPFFTDWGHISFAQVMILQSWFMLWIFILEIPTGTIADYFGRKYSLALGCLFTIIAALTYVSMPNFYVFLLAEFLWAVSVALFSGADEALIYDTLKKIKNEKKSKAVLARNESFHLAGIMISAPIGSIMAAQFGLTAPMIFLAVPLIIAFLISLTLKEPETNQKIESRRYINILKEGMKFFYKHRILKILALDMAFIAAIGYFMIWLFQPMLKQAGMNIAYFGLVQAALVLAEIAFMNNYGRIEKILGSKRRLIFFSAAMTGVMFIIGGLTNNLLLVLLSIIIGGGIGLSREPLFSSYMNKYIPSSKRATVLSAVSMLKRFVLVVVNPLVGYAVMWSLNYTLIILGAAAIIFAFISRVEEKHLID